MAPVRTRRGRVGTACLALLFVAAAAADIPANATEPGTQVAELDAKSRALLKEMNELFDENNAAQRQSCALGEAPGWVAAKRAQDGKKAPFPDASGMCIAIMESKAEDGKLLELYRDLLTRLGGDIAGASAWPRAIGAAAMGGKADVSIGHGKSIEVKPALAFDAGFTVAFQEGERSKAQDADPSQLLALAGNCIDEKQDAATCFSVGYLYGANAARGKMFSSR